MIAAETVYIKGCAFETNIALLILIVGISQIVVY